ncbi:MAG: Na/Pi cotransporter family protein [Clostridiaceae bacterium]|nr:Na/Pi cotransporter family protein [Clostridiaceae bacterium]
MNIFDVLSLFGGLALFLFGMSVMGDGLEKSAGSKLKTILERLTSSPLKGFVLGLAVTAVIQSSSATTVMVVGFVNSGIMSLRQAIGIIMGANVGTTVTSWILSLSGIQGDSFFVKMLKPSSFSPILAVLGIVLYMFVKSSKKKDIGSILLGFAVLMFGMDTMSSAVAPLKDVPEFTNILLLFSNPILGVLAGAVLTAIIQSSSASVGILQALSATGQITFGSAIPIILGQNIGTCATAMLSSVGTNKNARRTAVVHLYFNIIGTLVFLTGFYALKTIFDFQFVNDSINQVGIAVVHTVFNLTCTAVMLPFAGVLERLACATIKDEENAEDEFQLLDERLMVTPPVAIEQCRKLTIKMAEKSERAMDQALSLVRNFDPEVYNTVRETESRIDVYEDRLGTYLVKLSAHSLSQADSREVSRLLHTIGDFERISDHAVDIAKAAEEMHNKEIHFSDDAQGEIDVISSAVRRVLHMSIESFTSGDVNLAFQVEPLEQVVDHLRSVMKNRHVARLQEGSCTIELGFIFSDLLTSFERVSDHCSNIAACMIELQHGSYDTHEYLNSIKNGQNSEFVEIYNDFLKEYVLP